MTDTHGARLGAEAARLLRELHDCAIEPGLTAEEFERVEAEYGFRFADDHRAFLAAGLPVSEPPEEGATWERPWPDWRDGDPADLRSRLAWPAEGVLDAVERGGWLDEWGMRPPTTDRAVSVVTGLIAAAPPLVPLYAHRFIPAGRGTSGHPVLSIWGTDMVYYGADLAEYIDHEFAQPGGFAVPEGWNPQATVPFWKDFLG
ncbi:hypothetical protein ACPC54_40010 [Kitasatospora sp. NPDC094028]